MYVLFGDFLWKCKEYYTLYSTISLNVDIRVNIYFNICNLGRCFALIKLKLNADYAVTYGTVLLIAFSINHFANIVFQRF